MATVHIVSTPGLGRRFLLDSPETIIGRSRLAGIDLEGANVSRRHARIVCREGSFLLEDLGSSNGTFLNDQRLTSQAPLTQGDLIKIGGHILKFDGENALPSDLTIHGETAAEAGNEELYTKNSSRRLQAVLELAHQLANTLEIDPLLNRFLDQLLKLYPNADRLMVFFFEGDQPVIRVARDHRASAGQEGLFSHSVLRQVREKGAAVLAGDAVAADPNTSLHALGVRSLLCAPLRTPGSPVMGAVQMDRFKGGNPFTRDDLHLLTAVTLQISLIIEKARMHQSIVQQQRIARELMLAREIQLAYLPTEYPVLSGDARLDMFAELHPANEISGDFYDFFLLDDAHVAMVVADVCGKGMPAALFMSMVRALLRQIATQEREPSEILRKMNQALARDNPKLMFVTMVLAVFHPLSGRATIARAGHPAPLLRRADGTVAEIAAPTGCLIGIMDPCPAFKPVQLDLQPGETVIFYTDGVTEAAGQHDDSLFGTGRLFGCLEKSPPDGHLRDWSATIREDVRAFCGASGPQDDITLLMFRRSA